MIIFCYSSRIWLYIFFGISQMKIESFSYRLNILIEMVIEPHKSVHFIFNCKTIIVFIQFNGNDLELTEELLRGFQ